MRARVLLLGLSLSISRAAEAVEASGLTLETGSPDAFCPDLRQTREVVSRRLGSLEVPGRRGWRARYTIGHAPEGSLRDFIRLELFDPEGALELSRDLPMRGESCTTMAEVIALVLDRHFRSLISGEQAATSADSKLEPERGAEPLTVTKSSVAEPTAEPISKSAAIPSSPLPAASASERDSVPRHDSAREASSLGRAPLLLTGELAEATAGNRTTLGIRAFAGVARNLHLGSAVAFDLASETEALPRGGNVRASSSELRAFLAWGPRFGPLLAYVGPGLGLRLQRGEAEELPRSTNLLRAVWAGRLEAGFAVAVERRFIVLATGALELTIRPISGRFYVEEREVLKPRAVQPWIGLGAGYAFYP